MDTRTLDRSDVTPLLGQHGAGAALSPYSQHVDLLERDAELEVLRAAIGTVVGRGAGRAIAVCGESGAGKSSVIAAAVDGLTGLTVLRGGCDPLGTPRPWGPFRETGLASLAVVDGMTSAELQEQVYAELRERPVVLVVEDLHWVDEASVDLLRFLVRRIETTRMVLVVSYRDEEIGTHHPARRLLGDWAVLDGLQRLDLAPLSVQAVQRAVDGSGLDAQRVHELTGGNAFFVSQVVREPGRPLPASVRDAVLARVADVDVADLEALQLIACAPDRLDDRVLPLVGVGLPTLRRLDETSLLTRTDHGIVFRHELARLAVESTIPPGGEVRLHQQVLEALERISPRDPAVLTYHAVAARDAHRVWTYAREAATEAVASSSMSEAAGFTDVALAHAPSDLAPAERGTMLLDLATYLYNGGRVREAIDTVRGSIRVWEQAEDRDGLAAAYVASGIYEYHRAADRRRTLQYFDRAREIVAEGVTPQTAAQVHYNLATMAITGSDLERAGVHVAEMHDVASASGDDDLSTLGHLMETQIAYAAGVDGARQSVVSAMADARQRGLDESVGRSYMMLLNSDLAQGRLREAGRSSADAFEFSAESDFEISAQWQLHSRAHLNCELGRWDAALEDAERVLAKSVVHTMWAHLARGLVPLRRGEDAGGSHFDDAWAVAGDVDEPVRWCQAAAALAERMWTTGRPDPRVTEDAVAILARPVPEAVRWAAGNLATWLRRLGIETEYVAGADAAPYDLAAAGRHAEVADWWRAAGSPFAEAMALVDSDDTDDRVRGVDLLDRIGALGTADRLRTELRAAGVAAVPQRPRESTRANPGGLTNRQLDVARLVAQGLSNNEIAAKLFISPKTADHHVSAILAKLEQPHRRAVVVNAAALGLE